MAESRDEERSSGRGPPNFPWWPSDLMDRFASASLSSPEESLNNQESPRNVDQEASSSQTASQILWSTGMLSEPIPNGFYSVIPEKRLKELFLHIPTLEDLHALGAEGSKTDVILVEFKEDKKLSALRHLIMTLVIGLSSNPAAVIKKIAGLLRCFFFLPVSDVYKRPSLESPAKSVLPEISHMFENCVVQMLGHIKHGSCRPRAILFKVLADTVGLESRLMVGVPDDGGVECVNSDYHMSVIVTLNSVELLVDLKRYPGQLIPYSTKAIFMAHISAAGESDSAENDSCDSPLEPNSPLYGCSERVDPESAEKKEILQLQRRIEAPSNVSGRSLRNMMIDRTLRISQSEPNIATSCWRRSQRKVVAEQRTASSSPEHPSFRSHGRSLLGSDRKLHRDFTNQVSSSRSDGTSAVEARRLRRRSISITPEIGDDIVRAVRAMNETLKQNRLLRVQGDERSFPYTSNDRNSGDDPEDVSRFNFHTTKERGLSPLYDREHMSSQKATSLPSSPHEFRSQTSERSAMETYVRNDEMYSIWNKVLESPLFHKRPLLPFQEWNINFSEITIGTRVGIETEKLSDSVLVIDVSLCNERVVGSGPNCRGFFGEVFRGIWNGTDVAIKVFLEQDLTAENMEDFCNEISILSRLRHPNVILFLGACMIPPHLSMVTEYMEMGSLYYLIHLSGQKKKISWRRRLKILCDICRGLMCIHRMKIIHRDFKSANCLVNKHWTVKICDFGLSRVMTESPMQDSSCAGTPEWMAPELIRNEPLNEKCDIFSLGVIMWEVCTLNRPWDGVPPERVAYAVANEGSRLEIPDPEGSFGRLIADCWAEPQDRPNCEEILSRLLDCEYTLC